MDPYEVRVELWRDEQPGDVAKLHLSAVFARKAGASGAAWKAEKVASLELRQGGRVWRPTATSIEPTEAGFELKAQGEAPAGMEGPAEMQVALDTDGGRREVRVPGVALKSVN